MTVVMRPAGHPGGHPAGGPAGGATRHPGGHPGAIGGVGSVRPDGYVFGRAPMLVYWETTMSCGLACRHCRAEAMPDRAPDELTTDEGFRLLDAITGFGQPYPHIVFTGGDPLRRPDLEVLVQAATDRGIGASLAPAATAELTPERLRSLKAAGIQTMSLSLDGSTAERHDAFRGVPGTFEATLRAAEWTHEIGLPLQVNTLVTDETLDDLPAIYDLMTRIGIIRWSLFFLISIGRGSALREIEPGQAERLNHWLYGLSKGAPFAIKTTEATHYRRVAVRRMEAEGLDAAAIAETSVGRGFGVRDGNGILFVANNGFVFPSGFLPLPVGNVRTDDIVTLYREHPVFTGLRDPRNFKGRCGRCAYATICGGSRARAFAWTGDAFESDPLCPFVPPAADVAVTGAARAAVPAVAPGTL
ncbi:MAG TPA: TIGR04053 family radical SAM/SPASM domain-containing protein [Candidatus Limnocylindrales bacterium]|nr:TIGR04053 family radical SAM/SPASM domain-containing protein [Candidatus Limnocylindrales bacterium]